MVKSERENKDRFAQRTKTYVYRLIILVFCPLSIVLCTSCGVKKKTVAPVEPIAEEPEVPAWHTCLIQNARVTVLTADNRLSANATMQVVRDSMLVISIMPMIGIEMLRIEATPEQIIGIDKMHAQYACAAYEDLNRKLTPSLNWDELQQLCSAELPLGSERARLIYTYEDEVVELAITYPVRLTDVPVRIAHLPLNRYTQIDISRWL